MLIKEPLEVEIHHKRVTVIWTLALFLVSRLLYLLFLNPYFTSPSQTSELVSGLIGQEWLYGLHVPLMSYQVSALSTGWLWMAGLSALFFQFIGSTLFALKLSALVFSVGGFLFWFATVYQYVGKRVSFYFAVFSILAPPSLMSYSLTALGSTTETFFFSGFILYLFFKLIYEKPSAVLASGLGLALALGMSFHPSLALLWVPMAALCFSQNELFFARKPFVVFLLSFILLYATMFLFKLIDPTALLSTLTHFRAKHFYEGVTHFPHFVGYGLVRSLTLPFDALSNLAKNSWAWLYALLYLVPIAVYAFLRFQSKKDLLGFLPQKTGVFFVVHIGIALFLLQLSDFRQAASFMPILPSLFVLSSFACTSIENRFERQKKRFATCAVALIAIFFLFSNSLVLSFGHAGSLLRSKGYHYGYLASNVCSRDSSCLREYGRIKQSLSKEDLHDFSAALALELAASQKDLNVRRTVREMDSSLPTGFEPYFYYFLGREILRQEKRLETTLQKVAFLKNYDPSLYRMMGRGIFDEAGRGLAKDLAGEARELPEWLETFYWRAIGQNSASRWTKEGWEFVLVRTLLARVVGALPKERQSPFLEGVGKHFYRLWSQEPFHPLFEPKLLETLPKDFQASLFEGIGIQWAEEEFRIRDADAAWHWKEFAIHLDSMNQYYIQRGKKSVIDFFVSNSA